MPTPTPQQAAIREFISTNPTKSLVVDARAGTGKTSTFVMVADAITTRPVCALAFNKRNAEDLAAKLPADFDCKTLNAAGHRAWAKRLGSGKRLIVDADKLGKLTKQVLADKRLKDEESRDAFISVIALARAAKSAGLVPFGAPMGVQGLVPDTADECEELAFQKGLSLGLNDAEWARTVVLRSITEAFQGVIDFDDQIYMSALFGGFYDKYHTVIVDEAQDLSPLNHLQLTKLVGTRLLVIGDPYQAIYAFRGADNNSITNLQDRFSTLEWGKLPLTFSFRAPKSVASRQTRHVSDFESWHANPEGEVFHWPRDLTVCTDSNHVIPNTEPANSWSINEIPHSGAVLCRNNAPLMKLAFALIKARRPVTILGRDIGAQLGSLLWKISLKKDMPVEAVGTLVDEWETKELAKASDSEAKQSTIRDKAECLRVLLEASGESTTLACKSFIERLFSDRPNGELILSSGHRSKGMEWPWVLHLNPELCPSRQALKAADRGNPAPLIQERNLQYVIETRTSHTLVMASLETCEDIGE